MTAIVVRKAWFPLHIRRFARTWARIYADEPSWVAPLRVDLARFLNPWLNPYFRHADVQPFIAWDGLRSVGTIVATWDHNLQKTEPGVGLFGFFEFPDNPAIATALFAAAEDWLRAKGATRIRGPMNFNANHEFGLLIDPFDDPPCVANPYSGPWQPAIYAKLGLEKSVDWYGYWLEDGDPPPMMVKVDDWLRRRHDIELRPFSRAHFDRDCELFWGLYNEAWSANFGHVYMEKDEFLFKARGLRAVLDPRLAMFLYLDGKPAAASITLQDYNQVAIRMHGRLLPFGWRHLIRPERSIDRLRALVVGVHPDYQALPLGVPLYLETWKHARAMGVRGAEVSLVVEDNHRMRGALERLGGTISRTYRIYEKAL